MNVSFEDYIHKCTNIHVHIQIHINTNIHKHTHIRIHTYIFRCYSRWMSASRHSIIQGQFARSFIV